MRISYLLEKFIFNLFRVLEKIDSGKINLSQNGKGQFEELYRNVINSITNPLFLKDDEHRWILVNDSFCQFLGMERDKIIGKSDYDHLPKEQADVFWEKDDLVLKTGNPNINEEELTNRDGQKIYDSYFKSED